MTEEEIAIKTYLSSGVPLSSEILDRVLAPYWKQEPYLFVQNNLVYLKKKTSNLLGGVNFCL